MKTLKFKSHLKRNVLVKINCIFLMFLFWLQWKPITILNTLERCAKQCVGDNTMCYEKQLTKRENKRGNN